MCINHTAREKQPPLFSVLNASTIFTSPSPALQQYLILTCSRHIPTLWQKQFHSETFHSLAQPRHTPLPGVSQAHTQHSCGAVGQQSSFIGNPTGKGGQMHSNPAGPPRKLGPFLHLSSSPERIWEQGIKGTEPQQRLPVTKYRALL